jgi:hypothetical protein
MPLRAEEASEEGACFGACFGASSCEEAGGLLRC